MKRGGMLAGLATTLASTAVWAGDLVGMPTDKALGLQPAASVLKHDAIFFHNQVLLPIITVITVFVLLLLLIVIVRFNKKANPVPAKWSHNTLLEVVWTVIPVGVLVVIAAYSFPLLYKYDNMPKPDLTVKAVGHQWYWSYEYPDHEGVAFDSYMVEDKDLKPGQPRLLAVDNPIVVPVNKVVEVIVTAEDVIHNFALPAFGLKTDAVPGRINHTWFKAEKIGDYYGQCSELCGVRHAYMPIHIKVVSDADYAAWLAKNGAAPAAPAAAPVAADAVAPVAAPAPTPAAPVAAPAAH